MENKENLGLTALQVDAILMQTPLKREISYLKLTDQQSTDMDWVIKNLEIEKNNPGLDLLKSEIAQDEENGLPNIIEYLNLLKNSDVEFNNKTYTILIQIIIDYNCCRMHLLDDKISDDVVLKNMQEKISTIRISFGKAYKNEEGKTQDEVLSEFIEKNNLLETLIKILIEISLIEKEIIEEKQKNKSKI